MFSSTIIVVKLLPALLLGLLLLVGKPLIFSLLFRFVGENRKFFREALLRLGQSSEFSLIIAVLAAELGTVTGLGSQFIQMTAIVTMIVSCYLVVFSYPTLLGLRKSLKQD